MPKSLLERCRPDSIIEFRAAARERFADGQGASLGGRRTSAIYLWGYAAEMTIKAAYFSAIGFGDRRTITMADLGEARTRGISRPFTIDWPSQGRFHNVRAWAELLVKHRLITPGLAYRFPPFGDEVVEQGRIIGGLWSETLRYHKNIAYLHEVDRVRVASKWLLDHSAEL